MRQGWKTVVISGGFATKDTANTSIQAMLSGPGSLAAASVGAAKQLIVPMVLAPYCTNPLSSGGLCAAVIGKKM